MAKTTTQTVIQKEDVPSWYQDYLRTIAGSAQAVAGEGYVPYGGPRVAGFSPETEQAFSLAQQSIGSTQPIFNKGLSAIDASRGSARDAAQPYFSAAAGADPRAAAQPFISRASGMSAAGGAQPGMDAGIGMMSMGAGMSGAGAAQPYLARGASTFDQNVSKYMNPYTDQVVDRIGTVAARTLREKLLPEINDTFIGSGTFGGSRQQEFTGRAVRDLSETTTAAQAEALRAGYTEAAGIFDRDAGRALSAGQAYGQLTGQDADRRVTAGQGIGNMGMQYGELMGRDRDAIAGLGELSGRLTNDYATRMTEMGSRSGELAANDYGRQLEAGRMYGDTARAMQDAQGVDITRLDTIGQARQGLQQQGLDMAYDDFQRQRDYPKEQLGWLSNIVRGQNIPTGQTTQTQTPKPSAFAQAAGLATTAASLGKLAGAFKEGGKVKRKRKPKKPVAGIGGMGVAA